MDVMVQEGALNHFCGFDNPLRYEWRPAQNILYPQTHKDLYAPLKEHLLPRSLKQLLIDYSIVRKWLTYYLLIRDAEKVAGWIDWTPQQYEIHRRGDWVAFSKARGYTDEEIANYATYLELCATIENDLEEGLTLDFAHVVDELCSTPEMDIVYSEIERRNDDFMAFLRKQTSGPFLRMAA